jgi:ATP-dependent helicase IRC3
MFPLQVVTLMPGKRESTLVFCVDLKDVQQMTDTFRQYGVDARSVTSKCKRTTPVNLLTFSR